MINANAMLWLSIGYEKEIEEEAPVPDFSSILAYLQGVKFSEESTFKVKPGEWAGIKG